MTALLEVSDLTVHFRLSLGLGELVARKPRRVVRAVNGVSFSLGRGETLGLVGESGCGKTTLGRALLRLVQASSGRVTFDHEDVLNLDPASLFAFRRRAQMVFQDPHASLNPQMTVGQALAEVLRVHEVCPAGAIAERVASLMERVGLAGELASRRPAMLSGGQCQRVGIARALAVEPDLIIADESVSALDVSIQAQILNLFLRLQREMDLAMVFIAHDLGVVRHLCQKVAVMYLGRIVEFGPTEEVFNAPRHPYTAGLIEAIPKMRSDAAAPRTAIQGEPASPIDMPPGCPFHPRCSRAMDHCRLDPPPAPRFDGPVTVNCHLYPEDHGGGA